MVQKPDSIGSQDTLLENVPFIGTIGLTDAIIVIAPALMFMFVGDLILPTSLEAYTLPISILVAMFCSSLLLIKSRYLSPSR